MIWKTIPTQFVDLQTGEVLTETNNYEIIRKTKKIEYNEKRTRATIQWIGECRRNTTKQCELFTTDHNK